MVIRGRESSERDRESKVIHYHDLGLRVVLAECKTDMIKC